MDLYIALIHYPVYNKNGDIVTTSITTIDLHDISRLSKTYGVKKFFLVTPLLSQRKLVQRMLNHWSEGYGSTYNPTRKEALSDSEVSVNLEEVYQSIKIISKKDPVVIATGAKGHKNAISFLNLKKKLKEESPFLLLLGTGWGLTKEVMESADYILEPIQGKTAFNHLPVRAAAAIMIDRLLS